MLIAIAVVDQSAPPVDPMSGLYYVPIIFSALFFGFGGGMTCTIGAGALSFAMAIQRGGGVRASDMMQLVFFFAFAMLLSKMLSDQYVIREMAVTDQLTGLHNRRFFFIQLEREFMRAQRYSHPFSIFMFDIDDFKKFNDAHGHLLGDDLLTKLGGIVRESVRKTDFIARYGGEEFTVLLVEATEEGASIVAERTRRRIEEQFKESGITVSVGVAGFDNSLKTADDLLAHADAALYRAKRDGRNCVRRFSQIESDSSTVTVPVRK